MSNRRPPGQQPPRRNDPNQHKFNFDRFVPAQFANLDRLFALTKWVAATALAITLLGLGQGHNNQPTYLNYVYAVFALGGVLVFAKGARSLRQFQTKIVFVVIYVSVIVGSAAVIGFVFWQVKADWSLTQEQLKQRQEDDKRERERQKREQDDAAARKAEETRKAKCEQDRKWVIAQAEKQRPAAHAALVTCTDAYERQKKTAEDTVAQRCRTEFNDLKAIDRRKQVAEDKRCDLPAPK